MRAFFLDFPKFPALLKKGICNYASFGDFIMSSLKVCKNCKLEKISSSFRSKKSVKTGKVSLKSDAKSAICKICMQAQEFLKRNKKYAQLSVPQSDRQWNDRHTLLNQFVSKVIDENFNTSIARVPGVEPSFEKIGAIDGLFTILSYTKDINFVDTDQIMDDISITLAKETLEVLKLLQPKFDLTFQLNIDLKLENKHGKTFVKTFSSPKKKLVVNSSKNEFVSDESPSLIDLILELIRAMFASFINTEFEESGI